MAKKRTKTPQTPRTGRPKLDDDERKVKVAAWVKPAVRDRIETLAASEQPGAWLGKFLARAFPARPAPP